MKKIRLIGCYLVLISILISCADSDELEFEVEKPASIAAQEELNSYESLKTYVEETAPNFILGAGISIPDYNSKGTMYGLINSNFQEMTAGYGMKHGAVVKADGTLNLVSVNKFLEAAEAAGKSVFGHTLTWHNNQNAGYLNGLIAPMSVTTPSFPNAIDSQVLQDGSFTGWVYDPMRVSLAENQGMGDMTNAIKLEADAGVSSSTDLQFTSPEFPVIQDHEYEVVFYIKSDEAGEGSISFEGLGNNTPEFDYNGDGVVDSTFTTGFSWKEVRFKINDFQSDAIKMHFNLGYTANVNYLVDINNFYVYDTQGQPIETNLVENGDFEAGNGWGGYGNGSTRGITEDGMGLNNVGHAFYVTNPTLADVYYGVQTNYGFAKPLTMGETYELSFWVKGTAEGIIRPELQSPNYSSNGFGQIAVTKEWKRVQVATTASAEDRGSLVISYGEFAGTVYIDDVVLKSQSASGGETTIVNKTGEEKEIIIESALQRWISGMMENSGYVHAWDVVNEPMDDLNPYELKTGVGQQLSSDQFFWQDYLGKDYAVKAFKMARQYGGSEKLLFINDYNLEYSLDKCKGLIQYISYIEDQGAQVDGIGTQMHINLNANKENIDEMFRLLAATGKLIKVSELDVAVNTSNPTDEMLAKQADIYNYVVKSYAENIPESQRYGITVWGVIDSNENSSWLPGDKQGLWDAGFNRKPAYAGFANGLDSL